MAAPAHFFFDAELIKGETVHLDEQTARHLVQVLRKQAGDKLVLSNGKGYLATASIAEVGKKKCSVKLEHVEFQDLPGPSLHLAVAFTKNTGRNEWLLEKATELGVRSIIPVIAHRSEKEHIRYDRSRSILVSAMLQSQSAWLPELAQPSSLKEILQAHSAVEARLVAHCLESRKRELLRLTVKKGVDTLILIGPEGDLTEEEIEFCERNDFTAISLGSQRLRTETAAMAACAFFNLINNDR